MKDNGQFSRRDFLAATASVGACLCGLNGCMVFRSVGDTPRIHPPAYKIMKSNQKAKIIIDTGKVPELLVEGNAVKIIDSRVNESIIIANTGENGYVALSIACTHNGFEVEYRHDKKLFKCISANRAEFSCDGHVIDGPTTRALASYPVHLRKEGLVISNVA